MTLRSILLRTVTRTADSVQETAIARVRQIQYFRTLE